MPASSDDRLTKIEGKIEKLLERSRKMEDIIFNQQALHKDFGDFKKDFEAFKATQDSLLNSLTSVQKEVHFLQAENLCLKREMKELRASVEENVHASMANEAQISGVVSKSGEDLKAVVLDIAKQLSVNILDSDVLSVCRKGNGKKNDEFIHVKFLDSSKRDSFVAKGRKSRLKGSNSQPIYFNEPLSYYSRKLFFEARKLRKDLNYKFVWVKAGRIYVRKNEKESAILITCNADISTLRS